MDNNTYWPNKLLLSTVIGIIALFTSVLGFIPAVLGLTMAKEIPESYCPQDRGRAIRINTAAIVFGVIEGLVGLVILFMGLTGNL